ncbi:MAG: L-threonylcarbamoyladenylate synthase [Actinomycetota bacterium]
MTDVIESAALAALAGELIVLPTDTVYGIGTRPDDAEATARLFRAKGRPPDLRLPVLVASVAEARWISAFDERAQVLAMRFWAGALTLVLPRTDASARWDLGAGTATIAVRMPHHPLALALLARTGPLAVTSANRTGQPTPDTCEGLQDVFGDLVAAYLCEQEPHSGSPSTVVDLSGPELTVLRIGSIDEAAIRSALGGDYS